MSEENEVAVATEVAPKETENSTVIDFKMVTFSLADRDYSIDIMHVKEIAKASRFTFVPNTLPFVLGVYNLRGEIIPILDLRLFFNIDVPERDENKLENMLILTVDDQKFGVVVDKIDKVIGVQRSTIQPPHPLFGDINIKYIDGVVESNSRLYVLLDITKIFSSKEVAESYSENHFREKAQFGMDSKPAIVQHTGGLKAAASAVIAKNPPVAPKEPEIDLKFIKESLQNYSKFYVSVFNEAWVKDRYVEWSGNSKKQIQNAAEAKQFLEPFWSTCTDSWWTKDYAAKVEKLLPDNSAKQIVVWNPGCGKGMETYSLACVLKKRYPGSKIKIYAQDIDLLNVSNASLMSIPEKLATDWYGSYLTKKANGEYTFSQEIKDSIMFEYHDCKNANALPTVDIIFARDVLSLLDEKSQETVAADFLEKMKGNGIAVIGENEAMPSSLSFGEKTVGTLVAYSKE